MPKGSNSKLKLLYLLKIFTENTDEEHGISTQEIIEKLGAYDVSADRKTVYADIEELRAFNIDISTNKEGRNTLYSLVSRDFELAELKLLVDSVQSAKFITEKKSRELIKKIETLCSTYEAKNLQRNVIINGRVKTMNENILYNVDKIHDSINHNKQISFKYWQWNVKKKEEFRHDGKKYIVSPWALLWDDEYYYLVAFDAESCKMKHYRVDKMKNIDSIDTKRKGRDIFEQMDIPQYSKGLFGMYGGKETTCTLLCENRMAGVIIDRFGKSVPFTVVDDEHFKVDVSVQESDLFLGWIIGIGGGIKITAPESLVEKMKSVVKRLTEQYI